MIGLGQVQDFCAVAETIKDSRALASLMAEITHEMGFRYFALVHHIDLKSAVSSVHIVDYPPEWVERFQARRLYASDPIHRASHRTNIGFAWSAVQSLITLSAADRSILAEAHDAGLGDGFTVPAHIPGEVNGSCSFAMGSGDVLDQRQLPLVQLIGSFAFEAARKRRGKVTSVDKANVLETSQLWRQTVTRVAEQYADVTLEHLYVDACAMHLITNPRRFDVLLTENLFGDILSDEAAVITGSLGMLASASIGGEVGLYEPVHGSAPDIAGSGAANPCGAIASAAMMLRHSFQLEQEASEIELAIENVLEAGYRTPDIAKGTGGYVVTTSEFGEMVCEAVTEIADMHHAYHAV